MQVKLALPKGRLLSPTSRLLQNAGLDLNGYDGQSRSYRPQCPSFPGLFLKVFHEKDVPIQVAIGNYDLGICGLDWIEELMAKYTSSALVKVRDLKYGRSSLCVAASKRSPLRSIEDLGSKAGAVCLATEYPNLAESFALRLRLKRFKVFPLWGAAEAYPPENADLALVSLPAGSPLDGGLHPLSSILSASAFLIANRGSWESKDLSPVLQCLYSAGNVDEAEGESVAGQPDRTEETPAGHPFCDGDLWLGLPDGHQQGPTLELLSKAGIAVWEQPGSPRRPTTNMDGVSIKMVRPQDMPVQVANGNFDLAITGEDWLYDHLYRFPGSPVKEILKLGVGKVRIVAVVSNKLPVDSPQGLRELLRKNGLSALRIASEYTSIADRYARDNHLSPYRLIPTWGASEAFLPEDADLLIENVQTGRTLAQHDLKIIDIMFESSACLVGSTNSVGGGSKLKRMKRIIQALRRTVNESGKE